MRHSRATMVRPEWSEEERSVYLAPVSADVVRLPQAVSRLSVWQKWGYGMLVFSMLFAGAQAIRCGANSALRLEALLTQMGAVQAVHQDAQNRNAYLKERISLYRSPLGIEEMARERLSMVGQDEVLVRVYPASVASR